MSEKKYLGDMTLHEISMLKQRIETEFIKLCCRIQEEVSEKYDVGNVLITLGTELDGDDCLYNPVVRFTEEDIFLRDDCIRGNIYYSQCDEETQD